MPATPNRVVIEIDDYAGGGCGPKRTEWISEAGCLTQLTLDDGAHFMTSARPVRQSGPKLENQ